MIETGAAKMHRPTADFFKPKNGRYHVALLVGGPHDVYLELRDSLAAERGIWVGHHWEYHRNQNGIIPKDVDVVIVLKDMCSHPMEHLVTAASSKNQIPFVRTVRKWASMGQALNYHGWTSGRFPPITAETRATKPEPVAEIRVDPRQFAEPAVVAQLPLPTPPPTPQLVPPTAAPSPPVEPVAAEPVAVPEPPPPPPLELIRKQGRGFMIPDEALPPTRDMAMQDYIRAVRRLMAQYGIKSLTIEADHAA